MEHKAIQLTLNGFYYLLALGLPFLFSGEAPTHRFKGRESGGLA